MYCNWNLQTLISKVWQKETLKSVFWMFFFILEKKMLEKSQNTWRFEHQCFCLQCLALIERERKKTRQSVLWMKIRSVKVINVLFDTKRHPCTALFHIYDTKNKKNKMTITEEDCSNIAIKWSWHFGRGHLLPWERSGFWLWLLCAGQSCHPGSESPNEPRRSSVSL